jgi:hypothetical protein
MARKILLSGFYVEAVDADFIDNLAAMENVTVTSLLKEGIELLRQDRKAKAK